MAKTEKVFPDGIYYNHPHERSPDFVLGSVNIKPEKLIAWLQQQTPNEYGYVRLSILEGREKPYLCLDTYKAKPKEGDESAPPAAPTPGLPKDDAVLFPDDDDGNSIPF